MGEVLLFDLGGVLVEYSGVRDIASLLPAPASSAEILDRYRRCPHLDAFERGTIGARDFAERFVRDWGLRLPPDEFLAEFRSWTRGLLPGARELLASLRPRFRLAALSNSNALHWERNTDEIGVTALFDVALSSHHLGLHKPDPDIYRAALERLQASPEAVTFFDDSETNVAAAASLGIRAFHVEGVEGVRERLSRERIL